MKIEIQKMDRLGNSLEIGDQVELFDWGAQSHRQKQLGVVTLVWDEDDGRVSCDPVLVEDPNDFWTKALPNCVKIFVAEELIAVHEFKPSHPGDSFVVHDTTGSVPDQEFETLESAEAWVRYLTECRPNARPVILAELKALARRNNGPS